MKTEKIILFLKEFLFRKKSLNYLLWLLLVALIAEIKAIGSYEAIDAFLNQIAADTENNSFINYVILIARILFDEGSILVLCILIVLFLVVCYLKLKELKHVNELKTNKKEVLLVKTRDRVVKASEIPTSEYIQLLELITDKDLKKTLTAYYNFKRERGNIHQLEKLIKEEKLIEKLNSNIN